MVCVLFVLLQSAAERNVLRTLKRCTRQRKQKQINKANKGNNKHDDNNAQIIHILVRKKNKEKYIVTKYTVNNRVVKLNYVAIGIRCPSPYAKTVPPPPPSPPHFGHTPKTLTHTQTNTDIIPHSAAACMAKEWQQQQQQQLEQSGIATATTTTKNVFAQGCC